jgi:serine phosphatase RsbU (regulator of sigma subunit)
MPFLLQTRGPSPGTSYLISNGCLLGRNPDCDIIVPHDSVSRHHARIVSLGEYFAVEDLHSRNGTTLNNIVIHGRCRLSDGDVLRLCGVEFAYCEQSVVYGPRAATEPAVQPTTNGDGGTGDYQLELALDMRPRFDVARFGASPQAKLHALLDITQSLGRCFSREKIFGQAVDCLLAMIPHARLVCIILRDERGELLPILTRSQASRPVEHRVSRSIVEEAMTSKRAILSRDALHDPRFQHHESVTSLQVRSIMCAPLVDDDGSAFGVIQVETEDWERSFQQEELELLMGVTTQAAMAITLARLHEKELRRRTMERDLELAASVQRSLLPRQVPTMSGYRFADYYHPAEAVGGDYYDYVTTASERLAVIVADVAGHGISAAISMSKLSAEVRLLAATLESPGRVLTALNDNMWRQRWDSRFITLLIGLLDPHYHHVTMACAGHMPPVLRRCAGQLIEPDRERYGPPLGTVENLQYVEHVFHLGPGDSVAFYTDGISEASNAAGEEYGLDRLHARIRSASCPVAIRDGVIGDLARFMGSQPPEDDICFVTFGRVEDSAAPFTTEAPRVKEGQVRPALAKPS